MNSHDVLRRARKLVSGGWNALLSLDTSRHICSPHAEMVALYSLHDAIEVAARGDADLIIETDALLTVLAEPGHQRTLYDWEMEPTRTLRDVLGLIDRGIVRAALLARGGRA